ncbi:MAG: D-alanyl-D-alanine carboxypeptidase, partial [Pyrinomonadaceae bacterium]|nr:D-alanyl-D-alanine carboxypeptidase [Sphingobacteriaceae bacterium]
MKNYILVVLLVWFQASCAQTRIPDLASAYSTFQNDTQLTYGISSLTVLDAHTGTVLFSKNGTIGLAPASTLKTVTSATGYHLLGKDFTWETTLGYIGTLTNGILTGDIILTGGGDPSLGSNRYPQTKPDVLLSRWVAA